MTLKNQWLAWLNLVSIFSLLFTLFFYFAFFFCLFFLPDLCFVFCIFCCFSNSNFFSLHYFSGNAETAERHRSESQSPAERVHSQAATAVGAGWGDDEQRRKWWRSLC